MIFTGTLILTLSGFLARILGFYNRIFLSNLIGAKELGIYQLIFPIYMLCFSLCCHGFETGISNLTSRFFAKGQKKNAHHLVRLGCLLSFCLSILLMFALFEGADYLSTFILKETSAAPSLKIAAFCFHKSLSSWLLYWLKSFQCSSSQPDCGTNYPCGWDLSSVNLCFYYGR